MAVNIVDECQKLSSKNQTVKNYLKLIDDGNMQVIALLLTTYLLPAIQVKKSAGAKKFSKIEMQEQFVHYFEVCAT
jgi:hypothetical protein